MIVYWSAFTDVFNESLDTFSTSSCCPEPENIFSRICDMNFIGEQTKIKYCPAVKDSTKNAYALKFPFEYEFTIDRESEKVGSEMYDQKFFDNYLHLRSIADGMITAKIRYIFFCEESLEIMTTSPYFVNNDFTKSARLIPGRFNIGKWFRPLECAMLIDPAAERVRLAKDDDYCYVNFLTDENITLKKFGLTPKLAKMMSENVLLKDFIGIKYSRMPYWYKYFQESKQRSTILKEIKNNLMEG